MKYVGNHHKNMKTRGKKDSNNSIKAHNQGLPKNKH